MATTTGELIRTKLLGSSALVQRVAQRIYAVKAPQSIGNASRVVFLVVSDIPNNTLDGRASGRQRQIRLQVDSYAGDALGAAQISEMVDDVLGDLDAPDLSAWRENSTELFDDSAQLHRVLQEFTVFR